MIAGRAVGFAFEIDNPIGAGIEAVRGLAASRVYRDHRVVA